MATDPDLMAAMQSARKRVINMGWVTLDDGQHVFIGASGKEAAARPRSAAARAAWRPRRDAGKAARGCTQSPATLASGKTGSDSRAREGNRISSRASHLSTQGKLNRSQAVRSTTSNSGRKSGTNRRDAESVAGKTDPTRQERRQQGRSRRDQAAASLAKRPMPKQSPATTRAIEHARMPPSAILGESSPSSSERPMRTATAGQHRQGCHQIHVRHEARRQARPDLISEVTPCPGSPPTKATTYSSAPAASSCRGARDRGPCRFRSTWATASRPRRTRRSSRRAWQRRHGPGAGTAERKALAAKIQPEPRDGECAGDP